MTRRRHFLVPLSGLVLFACATLKGSYTVPSRHPEVLANGRPVCSATDCHQGAKGPLPYQRFDHTQSFAAGSHRYEAQQQERLCAMCHSQSFCNDCHVTHTELKPSAKNPTDTYRVFPHRGDYLSRHRIDGRVDPASCYRCHGNPKASKNCSPCHGK